MSVEKDQKSTESPGAKKSTSKQSSGTKMPDITIPDLSAIRDKIQVDKILSSIKSMVNMAGGDLNVDPKDALGKKVKELSAMIQDLSNSHDQLSKDFTKAKTLLSQLLKAVEAVRANKKKE